MTKSTITREQLLEIIETDHVQCGEASYLARMALAAMDSEPVAWLLSGGGTKNIVVFDSGNAYADPLREVTPLYRHAQPALVIPDEMTAEQAYEIGYYYGEPVNVFAR
ncbi:Eaa1 [Klebsiella variicola]|nr:Eaa1 [Klebsiella variicola]